MTKNKSIKVCRICGEYEGTAVKGEIVTFEKHRNVCRICRNKYHKNRREDLLDGVRNDSSMMPSALSCSPKWVMKKRLGFSALNRLNDCFQSSRFMSGGGQGGITGPVSIFIPPTSPVKMLS